jgi:hypothetical protein
MLLTKYSVGSQRPVDRRTALRRCVSIFVVNLTVSVWCGYSNVAFIPDFNLSMSRNSSLVPESYS